MNQMYFQCHLLNGEGTLINHKSYQRNEKVHTENKSKDVCFCMRHPQKRIKYYCEADETFLCSQCKKEHKGSQHSIKEFKVDVKKMKVEVSSMLKDYHSKVNQLLNAKKSLSDKIKDTDTKLNNELERITDHYNKIVEVLRRKKAAIIEDLRKRIAYKNNKIKDKYQIILKQIEKLKEGWSSLNSFSNQITK